MVQWGPRWDIETESPTIPALDPSFRCTGTAMRPFEEQAGLVIAAHTGSRRPLLVGRTRELRMLRGQLEEGLAGSGNIVVLSGEAGIGKSRLAGAICREASDAGALVLTGYCYDSAVTPPYGPFVELLEQYASLRSQDPERFPVPPPPLTQGTSYSALFGELRDFFLAIARDRPLAILMEDMHWADAESFELLRFVARQLARAPVLLVITYRNDEVTRGHPLHRLVPMLVREALAVRIDVSPFSDESVRALIEQTYQLRPRRPAAWRPICSNERRATRSM